MWGFPFGLGQIKEEGEGGEANTTVRVGLPLSGMFDCDQYPVKFLHLVHLLFLPFSRDLYMYLLWSLNQFLMMFAWLQMANLTNAALAKLVAAGVVLVPFDSSNLDQAIAVSWAGGTEAGGYELPDALSRYGHNH